MSSVSDHRFAQPFQKGAVAQAIVRHTAESRWHPAHLLIPVRVKDGWSVDVMRRRGYDGTWEYRRREMTDAEWLECLW